MAAVQTATTAVTVELGTVVVPTALAVTLVKYAQTKTVTVSGKEI